MDGSGSATVTASGRWSTWLVLLAFVLAGLATGGLLVTPVVASQSLGATSADASGSSTVTAETRYLTLVESQGPQIIGTLTAPVALAGLPLVVRRSRRRWRVARICAAVLLTTWVLIAGFSVGLFYVPSAMAMAAAAIRR